MVLVYAGYKKCTWWVHDYLGWEVRKVILSSTPWVICEAYLSTNNDYIPFKESKGSHKRFNDQQHQVYSITPAISKQEIIRVVTIAMICTNLASLWKFQHFHRPLYNPVKHLRWSLYRENSKPLSIFTKKLHCRCSLGF